jgi:cysteine desulfurase / selenocysteine lyase
MSTSGDGRAAPAAPGDPLLASPHAAPGTDLLGTALDPAVIARIANELFSAVPGSAPAVAVPPSPEPQPPASARGVLVPSPGSLRGPLAPSTAVTSGVPSTASFPVSLPSSGGVPSSAEVLVPWLSGGGAALPGSTTSFASVAPGLSATNLDPTSLRTMPSAGSIPLMAAPQVSAGPGSQGAGAGTVPWLTTSGDTAPWGAVGVDGSKLREMPTGIPLPPLGAERADAAEGRQAAKPPGDLAQPEELKPTVAASRIGGSTISVPSLVPELDLPPGTFDVISVRRDFPILRETVHGRPLIWLDNAATTQKPRAVIDRITEFYERENSNIHRGAHTLAARATDAYESARDKVRRFLHASSPEEIVFVRGATEGINLIAQSYGRRHVSAGDEIVITQIEHHSNIVPWQMLCSEKGAKLRVAPVDNDGQILLDEYEKLFTPKTRIASFTHVSNALGTITPVREMVEIAHRHGVPALVDGAQAVSHLPVDVQALDCDFYVFSGHKVFAPTGIGAVYGKRDVLAKMPPWQGGGNMITDVTFEKTVYAKPPARFEAGTGNLADAVGLGAALDYLESLGMEVIERYEHDLLVYATEQLRTVPGLIPIGTAREKASVLSFVLEGFRSEEVGAALDRDGIAVRAGHHCAQPTLCRFGLETSVRPSLALYNTNEEIDTLVRSLKEIVATRGK